MEKLTLETFIAVAGFVGGVIATSMGVLSGLIKSRSEKAQKEYAAQRDFQHLKRNYEGLSSHLTTLSRDIDENFEALHRELIEMKVRLERNDRNSEGSP